MVSLPIVLALAVWSGTPTRTEMIDFYSDHCAPCREMDSTVRDLVAMGYRIRRVNVDAEPALAARFQVMRIPCFVTLVDGVEVDRWVGKTTFGYLQEMCDKAISVADARPPAAPPVKPAPVIAAAAIAAPAPAPRSKGPAVSDATLIAESVRLRVTDPSGRSCGSGTIIDARKGEALILTCGHIFRDSKGDGPIEVDLFGPGGVQRIAGKLISYDPNNDVGLVSIRPAGQVAVARVAPPGYRVVPGEPVVTVGCNNGDDPTTLHSRVLAVNKFLGPANLQVEGEPIEGRSGGGVFSSDGMVVGICNAADRNDHAGYCAALPAIRAEMDRAGVDFVYKEEPKGTWTPALLAAAAPPAAALPAVAAKESAHEPGEAAKLAPGEQATLEEIQRRHKEGAEIALVIRNGRDGQEKSDVIGLDHVSPAFLAQLAAVASSHDTSLPRKTILEWNATAGYLHHEPIPAAPAP